MAVTVSTPRLPGRPRSEGKRIAIIDAARTLFMANAYESVTMDQVAKAAGVAKMTVYGYFQDKEALFEATVQSTSDMIASALSQLPGSEGRLEDELVAFGRTFLSVLFSPGVVSSMNRHIDLLARTPSLAKRFYDAGPGQTRARLAAFLTVSVGEERMPAEQAIDAASDLMSLWVGDKQQQLALGLLDPLSPDEIQRHVRRCTQLFIRAYGLRPVRAAVKPRYQATRASA